MKLFITCLLLFTGIIARGQNYEDLASLVSKGQYDNAITKAQYLIQKNAGVAYPYVVIGSALMAQNNYDSGTYYLTQALVVDHNRSYMSGWAHAYLGVYYSGLMGDKTPLAVAELQAGMANGMRPACKAWCSEELGDVYKKLSKNDSASYYLLQAIQLDESTSWISAQAYSLLGEVYYNTGQKDKAKEMLDSAVALNKGTAATQTAENVLIKILNDQKKYNDVKVLAYKMAAYKKANAVPLFYLGNIYLREKEYDSSLLYLQEAIRIDRDQSNIAALAYIDLGKVYIALKEKDKAIAALDKATALDKTLLSVQEAQNLLADIDHDKPQNYVALTPRWVGINGRYIRYYFQDTTNISKEVKQYIIAHEDAYKKINKVFNARLPEKMTLYVWNDRELARQLIHHELGYTDVRSCTSNVHIDQTIGHEMTHTLAYWGWGKPAENLSGFINEGVAVAFDQSSIDLFTAARTMAKKDHLHSVLDLWENSKVNEDLLYPVSGAFIEYLQEQSTTGEFRDLIKNQSIENAEKIYGRKKINQLIKGFDASLGLK